MSVDVTKLASGLTVITDSMPHLETAALGVWAGVGGTVGSLAAWVDWFGSSFCMGLFVFQEDLAVFFAHRNRCQATTAAGTADAGAGRSIVHGAVGGANQV